MGLIDYFKAKFFPCANDVPQEQTDTAPVQSVPQTVVSTPTVQEAAPVSAKYADSSSIPDNEKQYYREDEYYALENWNGNPVVTFDERKKTCIPSNGGLYVPEILLLDYCNKSKYPPTVKSGYPGFWWFQYGIRDVGGALRSLQERGFIVLNENTGKYVLTPTGQQELADNEYVPYFHRNNVYVLDVWEMNLLLGTGDKSKWREAIRQRVEIEHKKTLSLTINDDPYEIEYPYVSISTSGDERVCRMCKQFEGKLFRASEAPKLPLHPLCACDYMFHETPGRKKIRNPADFVMPAECTSAFCANSDEIMREKDIRRRLPLCEEGLLMLKDFLAPYRSARWNPPEILPCVEWSIHDYMALGEWEKASQATRTCVEAGAFKAKDGESQTLFIQKVSDASSLALEYLSRNPGTLQRNMYKKLCPPCDREALKWFLANSAQIRKEKADKTNRLYVADC